MLERSFFVIAVSGSGLGGLSMSNIIQALISTVGVHWCFRIVGFICLVMLTFTACVVRPLYPPPPRQLLQCFDLKPFRNIQFCLLFAIQFLGNFAFNVPSGFLPCKSELSLHWSLTSFSLCSLYRLPGHEQMGIRKCHDRSRRTYGYWQNRYWCSQ